jgi:molecular chaperone DnaK (HSP70)
MANDPLPAEKKQTFGTLEANQESVELQIMETSEKTILVEQEKYGAESEIGKAVLDLPAGLPANAPIAVTFELNQQGRLRVVGREPKSGNIIEGTFKTKGGMSETELKEAKSRATGLTVS